MTSLVPQSFQHLGQDLAIQMRAIASLVPHKTNPRTHSAKQIKQIARSIATFGMTNPVLIDADDGVLAGHGRIEALKLLGQSEVPVIRLSHLNEAQRRAYIIADNKLAENAGWDEQLLVQELEYISTLDVSFDLTLSGFEIPEIDVLQMSAKKSALAIEETPPPLLEGPTISRVGDLWQLGQHRLLCGDALDPAACERLLGTDRAQMVCTDPPYNVPIQGHVGGLGNVQHNEFVMASGEMSREGFTEFLKKAVSNLIRFSSEGSIHFIFMDWRHMQEIQDASQGYTELKNLCVWNKTNGGMGSLYRSKHELVFVFKNGSAPHINNVELGKYGRYRTNVWDYAGVNTFHEGRMEELTMHPTVKPIAMIRDAILDCSNPGGIILDPFGGSGTTLMAAEACGRTAALMELDPRYVDCTLERFAKISKTEPIHATSQKTLSEIKIERYSHDRQ